MCIKEGGKEVNLFGKILLINSNELHSTLFDELNYHSANMCLIGLNDKNSPYPTHRRWMLDVPFLKNLRVLKQVMYVVGTQLDMEKAS